MAEYKMRAPFKAESKCEARVRLRLLLPREGTAGPVSGSSVGKGTQSSKVRVPRFLQALRSFRGKAQTEEQKTHLPVPSCERE